VYSWVWGKGPRSWGVFDNFCVKNNRNLKERLLLTVSYRKKFGKLDACSPNNFVGRAVGGAPANNYIPQANVHKSQGAPCYF